jgi:cytoskeletal protein CcmA (bactofilin family)
MFFKKQQKETTPAASLVKISSYVTRDSIFKGDISTNDCVEISGEFIGNIDCKKDLIINEFGSILGTVKANKVFNKGKIKGKVSCEVFEGDKKSLTTDNIEARDVTVSGIFEGVIRCETLNVKDGGHVKNSTNNPNVVQAKNIDVAGKIDGDIACEILSTSMEANIKGKLFVNQLLNNGGTIDGFIGKFQKILEEKVEETKETPVKKRRTTTKTSRVKKPVKEKVKIEEKELLTTN